MNILILFVYVNKSNSLDSFVEKETGISETHCPFTPWILIWIESGSIQYSVFQMEKPEKPEKPDNPEKPDFPWIHPKNEWISTNRKVSLL